MTEDWKSAFQRQLLTLGASPLNAIRPLVAENLPRRLIRYRPPNPWTLANLRNGTEWFSAPELFNDPYDSSLTASAELYLTDQRLPHLLKLLRTTLGQSELDSISTAAERDRIPALRRALASRLDPSISSTEATALIDGLIRIFHQAASTLSTSLSATIRGNMRVCCLSERLDSLLMWAHYAQNHQGVSIEYDLAALPTTDALRLNIWPVIYSDTVFDSTAHLTDKASNISRSHSSLIACLIKARDWSYEHEWRIVVPLGAYPDETAGLAVPMPKPLAVHLGCRITPEFETQIAEITRDQGIPLAKMSLQHGKFAISSTLLTALQKSPHTLASR